MRNLPPNYPLERMGIVRRPLGVPGAHPGYELPQPTVRLGQEGHEDIGQALGSNVFFQLTKGAAIQERCVNSGLWL